MKYLIYTTADGRTGPIMAVVADKELEKDDCRTAVIPDCHPHGGTVKLCVCKTRAGNDAMWQDWFDTLHDYHAQVRKFMSHKYYATFVAQHL